MIDIDPFPRTLNVLQWEFYLNRPLDRHEHVLFHNMKVEMRQNKKLEALYNNCLPYKLYIPALTNLHGNCLFESLNYHNIGEDVEDLRLALSYIMFQYKNYKNFFDQQNETLEELFNIYNDIEYVYCRNTKKLYKYTYDIMCQDLATNYSWGNLPTQLILMVISKFFDVEFAILSDRFNQITYVHAYEIANTKPQLKKVYIGHIFENHYVPIDEITDSVEDSSLKTYKEEYVKFIKWGTAMQNKLIQDRLADIDINPDIYDLVDNKLSENDEDDSGTVIHNSDYTGSSFHDIGDQ